MCLSVKVLLFCLLFAGIYSCAPDFANPRLHNDLTYMAKPAVGDLSHWGTYVSPNIAISEGFNRKDVNLFHEINLHQSYTFKYGNIALGGFGFGGVYFLRPDTVRQFAAIQPFVGPHTYYGGGFRGSFNFNIPFRQIDFRFLGLDAVWSKEAGNYVLLREEVQNLPFVTASTETKLLTLALTSEACIKLRQQIQLAMKLSFGHVVKGQFEEFENYDKEWTEFVSANVFFTYDPLFCYFHANFFQNTGAKFGLGYRF